VEYNYEDIPSAEITPEIVLPVLQPTDSVPTPATHVNLKVQEKKLKPFETITIILIAVLFIYWGMGIKHVKKSSVKPLQEVVITEKKNTPKAIIKITPAKAQKKTISVNPRARTETRDPGWKKWGPKK
jgi:hypothetical protein